MKKFLLLSLVSTILLSITFADSIGYIDSALILKQYNKAITAQNDLSKKQKEFQDEVIAKQQELEKAKTSSKNEEELTQLKDSYEESLRPKKEELIALNQKLSSEIEKDIIDTAKKVAKQLKVDVVLDKQVVLAGGLDLTSLVLSSLNK